MFLKLMIISFLGGFPGCWIVWAGVPRQTRGSQDPALRPSTTANVKEYCINLQWRRCGRLVSARFGRESKVFMPVHVAQLHELVQTCMCVHCMRSCAGMPL